MKRLTVLTVLLLLALVVTACGPKATPTPAPAPTAAPQAAEPTKAPEPAKAAEPTMAPEATTAAAATASVGILSQTISDMILLQIFAIYLTPKAESRCSSLRTSPFMAAHMPLSSATV